MALPGLFPLTGVGTDEGVEGGGTEEDTEEGSTLFGRAGDLVSTTSSFTTSFPSSVLTGVGEGEEEDAKKLLALVTATCM